MKSMNTLRPVGAALALALALVGCPAPNTGVPTTPGASASAKASMKPSTMPSDSMMKPSTMPSDSMMKPSTMPSDSMMKPSTMPSDSMMPSSAPMATKAYFIADLTGASEVPAVSAPAGAGGAATATLGEDGKTVTINAWATGLTGDLTGAHIHMGAVGVSGDVVKPLTLGANKRTASGTWTMGTDAGSLTAANLADMQAGKFYVNMHTAANPNGELRGQLMAAGWAFAADLAGASEVPPVTTTANGVAWLMLSADKKTANVKVYTGGLSGEATGAHLHMGQAGASGDVVLPLTLGAGNRWASGTWTADQATMPLDAAKIEALVGGKIYANVHTAANPNGEVRGQLMLP